MIAESSILTCPCLIVKFPPCQDEYLIEAGLTPNTIYWYFLEDKFGTVYSKQVVTNGDGSITLLASDFPQEYFNKYAGEFELTVKVLPSDTDLVVFGGDYSEQHECITLSFDGIEVIDAPITIDNSNPVAVTDFYGLSTDDISVKRQQANNPVFINDIEQLAPLYLEPVNGSEDSWSTLGTANYAVPATPSDGYNIQPSEVTARGKDINFILNGVGARHYGYGFFEDSVASALQMTPKPKMVPAINIVRPCLFQNNATLLATTGFSDPFKVSKNEIDYAIALCAATGIQYIQLGYECNIKANQDVFLSLGQLINAIQTLADYIHSVDPSIKIGCDANNWDILGGHIFPGFDAGINGLNFIDIIRQYFQFDPDLNTYILARGRVAQLSDLFTSFSSRFTNGQKMQIAQSTFKIGNPLRLMNGEGLIYAEMLMDLNQLNIDNPGVLNGFTHYNCSRLVSSDNTIHPAYPIMVMMRGIMQNDGMIDFAITGSTNLKIQAYLKGSDVELYVLNPESTPGSISGVTASSVLSYYGDPTSPILNTYTGTEIILNPFSITKIVTA